MALVQRGDRADVGHDRLGLVALHHDRQARGALGIDNDTGRVDGVRVERLDDEPSERVVADDAGEGDIEPECARAAQTSPLRQVVDDADRAERQRRRDDEHDVAGDANAEVDVRGGDRDRERARLPALVLVRPKREDPARADAGDQAGNDVGGKRRDRDANHDREDHRPDDGAGSTRVLGQEREGNEDERDQRQAERDERPRGGRVCLLRRGGDQTHQDRPVRGHENERGQQDRAPFALRRKGRGPGGCRPPRPRGHHPLTAPAVRPRTKYFCSEKNTTSGSDIEMNAAAVSTCQSSPRPPRRFRRATVSTWFWLVPPRKTYATSRSFHTHRNWKMANAASAGTESGMISRQKIVKWSAPSIFADSMIDDGSEPM